MGRLNPDTQQRMQRVHAMRRRGLSFSRIGAELGCSADTARGMYYRWLRQTRQRDGAPTSAVALPALVEAARWDNAPVLDGDWLILPDVHLPYTRWALLELALEFGVRQMRRGQRQLLLLGDFINADALSTYAHSAPPLGLNDELDVARDVLATMTRHYDRIVWTMGNHELRIARALDGQIGGEALRRLLASSERVDVLGETRAIVVSGGVTWRCTHQRSYSSARGRTPARLALKYQSNVISAHEHHVAVTLDDYGRYVAISAGGLFDQVRLNYASYIDSTSPAMCNGFVFVQRGAGHLLTPYPALTDWDRWGMGALAERALG